MDCHCQNQSENEGIEVEPAVSRYGRKWGKSGHLESVMNVIVCLLVARKCTVIGEARLRTSECMESRS